MVIVNIFGGLGNQMFQYALGRHLSQKLKTKLKFIYSYNLTRTDFDPKDIPSIFDVFELAGEVEKFQKPGNRVIKVAKDVKKKIINLFQRTIYINESGFQFNKDILSSPNNCYLSGYWQSERYFKDSAHLIREDFRIKRDFEGNNFKIANQIKHTESVSVHLRGRDYITNESTKNIHLTCDYPYYERSLSFIKDKLKNPHFFVFSDDPEWAKSFLKTDDTFTFVEGNSWNTTNYEDLRLMSLCKHNIIANSSFGWWGAWLNDNPEKIVVAPQKWFADPDRNKQTVDLIPEGWIRV